MKNRENGEKIGRGNELKVTLKQFYLQDHLSADSSKESSHREYLMQGFISVMFYVELRLQLFHTFSSLSFPALLSFVRCAF